MKTSCLIALIASCSATKLRFMPVDLINEVDKEVNDTNYLETGTNVRSEVQGQLRNFLQKDKPKLVPE